MFTGSSILVALAVILTAGTVRAEMAPLPGGSSSAELEAARGRPIARVVIAGNRRVPADALAEPLVSLRPGKPFSPEGLAEDTRRLWDSGLVEDISVDLSSTAGGVAIRIQVRERPTVKRLDFSGNHAVDDDDLREAIAEELKPGDVLQHAAVQRAAQRLRDKYAEEGYFLAEAAPLVVPGKGGQDIVRFRIEEHDKLSVRRIAFVGNHGVAAAELQDMMLTGKGGILGSLGLGTGGLLRQDVLERDVLMIQGLYYDKGYLGVQVGTPRVMLSPDRSGIEVVLNIEEGPRYRIRALSVEERGDDGRPVEALGGSRHLREMVHARAGDYFHRAELAKDLGAIQTMYRDAGYAHVDAAPATELDPDRAQVDIRVAIKRNPPVRFGRIEIRGNTKTRDKVIRRELEIGEQALFNETKLERSRRRVQALGYFEEVDISTTQGDDPAHLDVHVEVTEKPTGTFQVGAGFSSVESFVFNAKIQQNNLFGGGRSLSLDAQVSGTRKQVDLSFFEPHLLDSPFSLSVNLFDQLRAYEQFSQASKGGFLTLGYPLRTPRLFASLTYTLQHDKLEAPRPSAILGTAVATSSLPRLPLANLFNAGRTSSLRPTITWDARNNRLFPTSGAFFQSSLEVGSALLGSENEFIRWRATGRSYHPLNADESVVLRFNSEAGMVVSPSPRGVPIFARFFLGGIHDVRGFPLRSLGPRLPLGNAVDPNAGSTAEGTTIGGNLSYYQNLELEFPIFKPLKVRGVIFTDLGNVWNTERRYCHAAPGVVGGVADPCFCPARLLDVRMSWGFGVRWLSPLGPLRFEWGFPIKRLPHEKPSLFEFSIGSSF